MENKLIIKNKIINIKKMNEEDYLSLTDIAKFKEIDEPYLLICNWIRKASTIEFLSLWERINNKNYTPIDFDRGVSKP